MSIIVPFTQAPRAPSTNSDLDARRTASWLKSRYSDVEWVVTDTDDDEADATIDFRYRLADGRLLTDDSRLYATVKEYAFFVRDGRFSKIDTAQTHASAVRQQFAIAHALTLKGIPSYGHLQRKDINDLVQEMRFGVDGVLHASERVQNFIAKIERNPDATRQKYRGFPVAKSALGHSKNMIDAGQFVAACNLPDSAKLLTRVSWLIRDAAGRNGMSYHGELTDTISPLTNVTKQQLQRWLDSIDVLYAIRQYAECETPTFRPFPAGVMKVANQWGVDSKPTPVPPPRLVLHLLEASAVWVGRYSAAILDGLAALEDGVDPSEVVKVCQSSLPTYFNSAVSMAGAGPGGVMERAVELLATACWINIIAFTARRYEESVDLGDESSLRGDNEDGWWLHCLIKKTTKEREWIPVPLIVARSFEVLLSISERARGEGVDDIFVWLPPAAIDRRGLRQISPRKLLNEFAELVGVPTYDDGKSVGSWHWIPRQFRRFFAVLYFYRFEGADIAILSYFLRHFDIETTRGYVTRDPEVSKIWRDVEKDYTRRLADSIASGERQVGGAMGERLKKIAKLITERLQKRLAVSPESVGETLSSVMKRGGLVITPKPWVTCTCPRTQNGAKKARCRVGQELTDEIVGPSYADAGPTVCKNCRWALMEPSKCAYASRTEDHLKEAVGKDSGADSLFRELQRSHLVELQAFSSTSSSSVTQATDSVDA